MKATKNNGTFESINMVDGGTRWIATRGEYEIWVSPVDGGKWYTASFFCYERPRAHVECGTAKYALGQLAKECKSIRWCSNEHENFFDEVIFPLAKDLNDFMNRPPRETYNSR